MITFSLSDRVTAFSTTRRYGRDKELLCPALGLPTDSFFRPHQVHGTKVLVLKEQDASHLTLMGNDNVALPDCDAVIYDIRNACIGISTADCIPVVCYDPQHHCAAAIHAGWRGTVARIVEKTIHEMEHVFGTDATQLRCAIGPGISLDSFEVGDEVYDAFKAEGFDMDKMSVRKAKWHLDIKHCNKMQLMSLGVKPENIIVSPLDTKTDVRFFSARREGAGTGRMLTGIVLR